MLKLEWERKTKEKLSQYLRCLKAKKAQKPTETLATQLERKGFAFTFIANWISILQFSLFAYCLQTKASTTLALPSPSAI